MSEPSPDDIAGEVRERFARLAFAPHEEKTFLIGADSAKTLGYDAAELDALPTSVTESFAGVGNPFALGALRSGDVVFDLGSGAGLDGILAARRVGATGAVIGVDFVPAMVMKAQHNAAVAGVGNANFLLGSIDALPVCDGAVDIVISNGVFNLCPDKRKVVAEMFRVLRPGGRVQMADMLLYDRVTPEEVAQKGAWSA
jgi:SAM-dependent methyltransferase